MFSHSWWMRDCIDRQWTIRRCNIFSLIWGRKCLKSGLRMLLLIFLSIVILSYFSYLLCFTTLLFCNWSELFLIIFLQTKICNINLSAHIFLLSWQSHCKWISHLCNCWPTLDRFTEDGAVVDASAVDVLGGVAHWRVALNLRIIPNIAFQLKLCFFHQ